MIKEKERRHPTAATPQLAFLFGNNICPYCQLTVAEFLNGKRYSTLNGPSIFIHDQCYAHVQTNTPT